MNTISNKYEFASFCIDENDEMMQKEDARFHDEITSRHHEEERRAYEIGMSVDYFIALRDHAEDHYFCNESDCPYYDECKNNKNNTCADAIISAFKNGKLDNHRGVYLYPTNTDKVRRMIMSLYLCMDECRDCPMYMDCKTHSMCSECVERIEDWLSVGFDKEYADI